MVGSGGKLFAVQRAAAHPKRCAESVKGPARPGHGPEKGRLKFLFPMTPYGVHHGQAQQLRSVRQAALDDAFRATPNRFKGRRPEPPALSTAAWINPPPSEIITPKSTQTCAVNS